MAHLFVEVKGDGASSAAWKPVRLDIRWPFALNGSPPCEPDRAGAAAAAWLDKPPAEAGRTTPAQVAPVCAPGLPRTWVLLCGPRASVMINGRPVALGIGVLDHRDLIVVNCAEHVGGERFYFSSEEPATVERFPGAEPVICPRCKTPIELGESAVRCPACDFWHHQVETHGSAPSDQGESQGARRARPCWTYLDRCANCGASSTLNGALTWTPDEV